MRKNRWGLTLITPATSRPTVITPKNSEGPKIADCLSVRLRPASVGLRKVAMQTSAPTYTKMPSTARAKLGMLSRASELPMLGGTSALVSSTFMMATSTKAMAISAKKIGNAPRQPMAASTPITPITEGRNAETELPIPLKPWARARFRL